MHYISNEGMLLDLGAFLSLNRSGSSSLRNKVIFSVGTEMVDESADGRCKGFNWADIVLYDFPFGRPEAVGQRTRLERGRCPFIGDGGPGSGMGHGTGGR